MEDAEDLRRLLTGYVQVSQSMPNIKTLASNCANDLEDIIQEITDESGCTAIHVAVRNNNSLILSYLLGPLDAHQKVNLLMAADDDGDLPIHHAALKCNGNAIQHLRSYFETNDKFMEMMKSQNKKKESAMHCAMAKGDKSFVKQMLSEAQKRDAGGCMKLLECEDANANTPVHRAAAAGCHEALKEAMNYVQPKQKNKLFTMRNGKGHTPMDAATAARKAVARPFDETIKILTPPQIN